MSDFAKLFENAENFTVTGIHVTKKTVHHGNVNHEGTGYKELTVSREVSINLTDNRGMVANINAEFYENFDNLDFGLVSRYNDDFGKGRGELNIRLSSQSDTPMWLVLTDSELEDADITQYMIDDDNLLPEYASLFAANLLESLISKEGEYTPIKRAFLDSFR